MERDDSPYSGVHYQLRRTLNSPQSLSRPHPPIMVVGSGEQKTLRFVARYAQVGRLAEAGIQTVLGGVVGVSSITPLEIMGERVIPAVAGL